MTKTLNIAPNIAPTLFSVGADILAEQMRDLHRTQNYSTTQYGECHFSLTVGLAGWDDHAGYGAVPAGDGNACATFGIRATATAEDEFERDIWIDPDHALGQLECAAEGLCEAGNVVRVVFSATGNVGAANATLDLDDSRNGDEVMQSLDLSDATTGGWVHVVVSVQRIAGASANNEVRTLRAEELPLTSLPDPSDD